MTDTLESVARAQERVARILHRRKPMWRRSNPWYIWVLIGLLFVGLWAMNLIHT